MTRIRMKILIGAITILLLSGIGTQVWQWVDQRAIDGQASEELAAAQRAATVTATPEFSRDWLKQRGYQVVAWAPQQPRGYVGQEQSDEGNFQIIRGQQQVRYGGWFSKPAWIWMTFRFNRDGSYHDVTATRQNWTIPSATPAS